jgi:hypothetical protein
LLVLVSAPVALNGGLCLEKHCAKPALVQRTLRKTLAAASAETTRAGDLYVRLAQR